MKVTALFCDFDRLPAQPGDQFYTYRPTTSGVAVWIEDIEGRKVRQARRYVSVQIDDIPDYTFEWEVPCE